MLFRSVFAATHHHRPSRAIVRKLPRSLLLRQPSPGCKSAGLIIDVRDREFPAGHYRQSFDLIDRVNVQLNSQADRRAAQLRQEERQYRAGNLKISPKQWQLKQQRDLAQTQLIERTALLRRVLDGLRARQRNRQHCGVGFSPRSTGIPTGRLPYATSPKALVLRPSPAHLFSVLRSRAACHCLPAAAFNSAKVTLRSPLLVFSCSRAACHFPHAYPSSAAARFPPAPSMATHQPKRSLHFTLPLPPHSTV